MAQLFPETPFTSTFSNMSTTTTTAAAAAADLLNTPSLCAPLAPPFDRQSDPLSPPYTPRYKGTPTGVTTSLHRLSIDSDQLKPTESSRLLSDNELSYFLPSRQDGVNDMYLHHTLTASSNVMDRDRILHLWAYQLVRHPLLASYLDVESYEEVRFVHPRPSSTLTALAQAEDRMVYLDEDASDLDIIDMYLNGPRSLSNERLAMLVVANKGQNQCEVMLCATHFLGDGMALHTFMNEFYTLLGSSTTTVDSFTDMISAECAKTHSIPCSLEDRLPAIGKGARFANAVGRDDNSRNDAQAIGGQSFPANGIKKSRKTIVPTFPYTAEETKAILARCKANGVTIAHAVFALCNIAWSRRTTIARESPCLIYSALNLRPNLLPAPDTSYFHLAVGYFNIILPSLLPPSLTTSELFWHRARMTKSQTIKAVKSPFAVSRSKETNLIRRTRAIKWAKIDDEEEAAKENKDEGLEFSWGLGLSVVEPKKRSPSPDGNKSMTKSQSQSQPPLRFRLPTPPPSPQHKQSTPAPATPTTTNTDVPQPALPPASQKALMGVSMLGNLDAMYSHKSFPDIQLGSLTTGSRQRPCGLLLFAYTFAGKLWLSLGYDINGFAPESIEGFWEEVQSLVREVLL